MGDRRIRVAEAAGRIDWDRLSDSSKDTLRRIAVPVWLGLQYREFATQVGLTESQCRVRMSRLRQEIRAQLDEKGES